MNIDQKIAEICQSIDGLNYLFSDWTRANVELDSVQMPVLLNLLPVSGATVITNGRWRESRDCMFAFLAISEYDCDASHQDAIVNQMREFKRVFIREINDSGYFKPIEGEIKDSVVLDKLDVNVAGIVVQLTLTENGGQCYR